MPSRRDLIRMSDEEVSTFLEGRHVLNVATRSPDGSIHLVAMWYGFVGAHVAFVTFAKSQKVRNLRRDPRLTCLVEAGHSYDELRGVEIVGRAELSDDPDLLVAVGLQVARRYYGVEDEADARAIAEGLARKRVVVEVVPDRIVSWNHDKLGGTY